MAENTDGHLRLVVTPSVSGTTVTWTVELYTLAYGWADSQAINYSGAVAGTHSYYASAPSSSSILLTSFAVSASGARGTTLSASFAVTGAYNGDAPAVSASMAIPALVPATPNAPTVSAVTAGGVTLTAVAPANNGAAIDNYRYGWSTDGTTWTTTTDVSTTKAITGLAANTAHLFRVEAHNSVGWSAPSSNAGPTTTLPTAPAAVTAATVTRTNDNSHTIAWTRNATTGAPYASIDVQRWDNVTNVWASIATLAGTATTTIDTSTIANRRYQYRIAPTNAAGTAAWANTATGDTTPADPTSLVATKVGANITLAWTNNCSYDAAVEVWELPGGGSWTLLTTLAAGAAAAYTHTAPSALVSHTYRVRAKSASPVLNSGYATSATVVLLAPPNAPTTTGPTATQDASLPITLAWTHNPVDSTAQTAYQTQWRVQGAGAWTTGVTTTSATQAQTIAANTLTQGAIIEWQVRTTGGHATASPWSATAAFETSKSPTATITAPTTPHVLPTVTPAVTYYQLAGVAQAGWEVQLLNAAAELVETHAGTGAIPTFATVLPDGTTWTIRARVQSAKGLWSTWASFTTTIDYTEPATPIASPVWNRGTGAVEVGIENPNPGGGVPATVYNDLYRRINGGPWVLIATGVPAQGTFVDRLPTVAGLNEYQAVAFSALPSSAASAAAPMAVAEPGWLYVNYGPGFATMVRVYGNLDLGGTAGRERVLQQFAGRTKRVQFIGEAKPRARSVGAKLTPDASTLAEWEDMATESETVCVRDCKGNRMFGSPSALQHSWARATCTIAFSVEETDHVE